MVYKDTPLQLQSWNYLSFITELVLSLQLTTSCIICIQFTCTLGTHSFIGLPVLPCVSFLDKDASISSHTQVFLLARPRQTKEFLSKVRKYSDARFETLVLKARTLEQKESRINHTSRPGWKSPQIKIWEYWDLGNSVNSSTSSLGEDIFMIVPIPRDGEKKLASAHHQQTQFSTLLRSSN